MLWFSSYHNAHGVLTDLLHLAPHLGPTHPWPPIRMSFPKHRSSSDTIWKLQLHINLPPSQSPLYIIWKTLRLLHPKHKPRLRPLLMPFPGTKALISLFSSNQNPSLSLRLPGIRPPVACPVSSVTRQAIFPPLMLQGLSLSYIYSFSYIYCIL